MNTIVIANWEVRAEHLEHVLTLISELQKQTLQEKGNVNYQVFQSIEEPYKLTLFEEYVSEEAFSQHLQNEHYKQIVVEKIHPVLSVRMGHFYTPLQ